jgi:predicted phosphodiesterase
MSLVRVFSDLHLEFGIDVIKKCTTFCLANKTKYTILAGDITNFKKREKILTRVVSELKPHTDHIIYVLGNHEYYEPGNKRISEIKNDYKKLCNNLGISLLEDSSLETDDFVFYGATMWTKPTIGAFLRMNDHYSFKDHQEVVDLHEESVFQLSKFLAEHKIKATNKPLIVVTHHLPSFELIDDEYKIYGELNTGFASELDHLIKDPVNYWIYGHTHKAKNVIINDVQLLCNPHGYPKERKTEYPDCIF